MSGVTPFESGRSAHQPRSSNSVAAAASRKITAVMTSLNLGDLTGPMPRSTRPPRQAHGGLWARALLRARAEVRAAPQPALLTPRRLVRAPASVLVLGRRSGRLGFGLCFCGGRSEPASAGFLHNAVQAWPAPAGVHRSGLDGSRRSRFFAGAGVEAGAGGVTSATFAGSRFACSHLLLEFRDFLRRHGLRPAWRRLFRPGCAAALALARPAVSGCRLRPGRASAPPSSPSPSVAPCPPSSAANRLRRSSNTRPRS